MGNEYFSHLPAPTEIQMVEAAQALDQELARRDALDQSMIDEMDVHYSTEGLPGVFGRINEVATTTLAAGLLGVVLAERIASTPEEAVALQQVFMRRWQEKITDESTNN